MLYTNMDQLNIVNAYHNKDIFFLETYYIFFISQRITE